MKPRVVLVGRTSLLRSCITAIIQSDVAEASLVLIRRDVSELDNSLLQYCQRNHVPVLLHSALSSAEVTDQLQRINPALLLSIYNAELLGRAALEAAELAVNFHGGPLPRYAGLNAEAWALLNDEPRHGVTWHLIDREVDTGPIVSQEFFDIEPTWNVLDLISACMRHGSTSFRRILPTLLDGTYRSQPQDLSKRSYFSRSVRPFGGNLPLSSSWEQFKRLARATSYFPLESTFARPFICIDGSMIELLRFRALRANGNAVPGQFIGVETSAAEFAIGGGKLVVDLARTAEGEEMTGSELASRLQLGPQSSAGDVVLN